MGSPRPRPRSRVGVRVSVRCMTRVSVQSLQSYQVPDDALAGCDVFESRTVGLRDDFQGLLDLQDSKSLVLLLMVSIAVSGHIPVGVRDSASHASLESGQWTLFRPISLLFLPGVLGGSPLVFLPGLKNRRVRLRLFWTFLFRTCWSPLVF